MSVLVDGRLFISSKSLLLTNKKINYHFFHCILWFRMQLKCVCFLFFAFFSIPPFFPSYLLVADVITPLVIRGICIQSRAAFLQFPQYWSYISPCWSSFHCNAISKRSNSWLNPWANQGYFFTFWWLIFMIISVHAVFWRYSSPPCPCIISNVTSIITAYHTFTLKIHSLDHCVYLQITD